MEKIKPVTMVNRLYCIDQDFITYVDKIEKIHRELKFALKDVDIRIVPDSVENSDESDDNNLVPNGFWMMNQMMKTFCYSQEFY